MKYLDEYRDAEAAQTLAAAIARAPRGRGTSWRSAAGRRTPSSASAWTRCCRRQITLIHGPGCPVCVTPLEMIDKAVAIAARPEVMFCSFGDMLRVPGSAKDLLTVKSEGGDVRIVYSPMDAVALARKHPERQVVFFAVGFETTAPANAMAVAQAARLGLENFSVLVSHVLVPPAMRAVLSSPANRVQGFLAAGHVCTIMGMDEYRPIAAEYHVPIVVTGFEPLDILQGVLMCVEQLEAGRARGGEPVRPQRPPRGQPAGDAADREVFESVARKWRGIGEIPASGLALREAYAAFDAERRFGVDGHRGRGAGRVHRRARCCRAIAGRTIARPSASTARRSGRWAPDGLGRRGLRGVLSLSEGKRDQGIEGIRGRLGFCRE